MGDVTGGRRGLLTRRAAGGFRTWGQLDCVAATEARRREIGWKGGGGGGGGGARREDLRPQHQARQLDRFESDAAGEVPLEGFAIASLHVRTPGAVLERARFGR